MPAEVKEIRPQPGFQERFVRSNADVAWGGGVLNPQSLDSHILTPYGWKTVGSMRAGDEVCGLGGSIQHVTHVSHSGVQDCATIILEDGSMADSALSHKWWVLKDGQEMTAVTFEILECFQNAQRYGYDFNVFAFRYIDGTPVPVRIREVRETGRKEVACVGVSNDDQLYITDDYIITKNCGKAQPLDALVLTPSGWVKMGDLQPGDVISDANGSSQYVLRVYEKGVRDVYKIKFDFGEVEACKEHLFLVRYRGVTRTMTVGEMLGLDYRQVAVRCPAPVSFNNANELPIEPYLLGRALAERSVNSELISKQLRERMREIGIRNSPFIPQVYMMGTIRQRKDLLRGYLDARAEEFDVATTNTTTIIVQKSLAKSLANLVASLGGDPVFLGNKGCWDVKMQVTMPNLDEYYSKNMKEAGVCQEKIYRRIRDIRYSRRTQTRCILVSSSNHLYVTNDFVATHNTFAAILMVAEPSLDPKFRAVFTRRNLANLKAGGGIVDDFKEAYGGYVDIKTSENPRIQFPSGAFVDCNHIADESPGKLLERIKGWQYDCAYMDELTSYEFTTFSMLGTRVRGKAEWTGKMRGTTNPKRTHWTRKMLDWYIGFDGFVLPERDGVVRYFYQLGETVEDIVMADSKEEVYRLCKPQIDRQLLKLGGADWDYRNMIRSFVFYLGRMSENKASVGNNASYVGAVAAVGGKRSQQLIEGNFNVDEEEDDKMPIPSSVAMNIFTNDEARNGDHWITVDLADVGKDNVVAIYWDGFHADDMMIITSSTPKLNYERIAVFAKQHGVPENRIIYDAIHASYMYDYMPEATPFIASASPAGMYALQADRLKDECYLRLVDAINRGEISVSERVAKMRYIHKGISEEYTVQTEILEECSVVRFRETPRGKKKLLTKKEMNKALGKDRSMDVLDPFAQRMFPVLQYQYGEELDRTSFATRKKEVEDIDTVDIYDDTLFS